MYKELIDEKTLNKNICCNDDFQQQKEEILKEIKLYEKKILEYSNAVKNLYLDKSNVLISESDYKNFSRDFVNDKERLVNLVNELKKKLVLINEKSFRKIDREEIITKYANIDKLDYEIVQKLIDHICVGRKNVDFKEQPVEIFWNF